MKSLDLGGGEHLDCFALGCGGLMDHWDALLNFNMLFNDFITKCNDYHSNETISSFTIHSVSISSDPKLAIWHEIPEEFCSTKNYQKIMLRRLGQE